MSWEAWWTRSLLQDDCWGWCYCVLLECDRGHVYPCELNRLMTQIKFTAQLRPLAPRPPCHSPKDFNWSPSPPPSQTWVPCGIGRGPRWDPGLPMSFHVLVLKCAVKKYSGLLQGRRHILFLRTEDPSHLFSVPVPFESFIGKKVIFHSGC